MPWPMQSISHNAIRGITGLSFYILSSLVLVGGETLPTSTAKVDARGLVGC